MANIAAQRIKREFKEVIKSEEVGPPPRTIYSKLIFKKIVVEYK